MNFRPARTRFRRAGFDMTPMIDVVFQLIIFFMFTSQFSQLTRTVMDLPRQPGEVEEATPATLVIDIVRTGAMYVDAAPVTLEQVERIIEVEIRRSRELGKPLTVTLRADRLTETGHVNAVVTRLRTLGVERWKLATSGSSGGAP